MAYSQPPKISLEEFVEAQTSIWYNPNRLADGRANYTPEALIAIMRGARYDSQGPLFKSDMMITDKAMRDLADFLGFDDVNLYNSTMFLEGSRIFRRAKPNVFCAPNPQIPIPTPVPATSSHPFPVFAGGSETKQLSDQQEGMDSGTNTKSPKSPPSYFDLINRGGINHGNEGNEPEGDIGKNR